jgi:uncharacterized membrane protein YhiD involved in acid resistance
MLTRLLVTIVISLLLIIVIHYLYTYFKETLTNPIEKQIIQQTQEKYEETYKLSQPSQSSKKVRITKTQPKKNSNMEDELNNFIETLENN